MENRHSQKSISGMLAGFASGAWPWFALTVVASAVSLLAGFLLPRVIGFTVDSVLGDADPVLPGFLAGFVDSLGGRAGLREHFVWCAAAVAVCAVASAVFGFLSRISAAKGTEYFTKRLRDTLFRHVQYLSFKWHTDHLTGDIIQRCTSDVETAKRFVSDQLIEVVRTVILLALALVIMFSMDVRMALLILAFVPVMIAYTLFFYRRVGARFLEADEAEGELMVRVQENLTGVRVVRTFGRERYELSEFDKKNDGYTRKWESLGYTLGTFWGIGDIVSAAQLLCVVTVGAMYAARGTLSLGNLLVFISYTVTLARPVRAVGRVLSEMSKAGVSLRRIKDILDAEAEEPEPGTVKPPLDGDIVFSHVTFSYGDQDVLKDVSFTVPAGSTFGIMGSTGSGKSTITYLLNRLYELPEGCGSITIGGTDIRDIDRHWLRRNIGLVLQEPFLFSKTVSENIDIAARTGDPEKVREAARTAAVDSDVLSFASGYDTVVGERGVTLSGGQKQRIAIARSLMLDTPIKVFDDSMSNLDMETDAQICAALREDTRGSTVMLISHRISTLMHSDIIMVLEDGRVAEIGTHRELLEKGGAYRRVYDIQASTEGGGRDE